MQNLCEKSRSYNDKLIKIKIIPLCQEHKWRQTLEQPDIKFNDIYLCKIKNQLKIKIGDFNFKVLHINLK